MRIEFCQPIPGIAFDPLRDDPPRRDAGFFRSLSDFPINAPTTLGARRVFGESEMVLVLVKTENCQACKDIRITFHRPDGSIIYQPKITRMNHAWATLGRFDASSGYSKNEITETGDYTVNIESEHENYEIRYRVD